MSHVCYDGGWLVGEDGWLPEAAFDYQWPPLSPHIGCNRLRCAGCGDLVRSRPGKGPGEEHARVYFCGCTVRPVFGDRSVNEPIDPISEETLPWSCAGHPPLELPARVDGVALEEGTDWRALAREVMSGARAVPLHPSVDGIEGFWVQRVFHALEGPAKQALARAVGELLLDEDPRVRLGALRFYEQAAFVPGAERVAEAVRAQPEHFSDPAVRRAALNVLGMRTGDDPRALEVVQEAALRPPGVDLLLYTLGRLAPDWVLGHAAELVRAAPAAWADLLEIFSSSRPDDAPPLAHMLVAAGLATAEQVVAFAERRLSGPLQARVVEATRPRPLN